MHKPARAVRTWLQMSCTTGTMEACAQSRSLPSLRAGKAHGDKTAPAGGPRNHALSAAASASQEPRARSVRLGMAGSLRPQAAICVADAEALEAERQAAEAALARLRRQHAC
eukprot:5110888-Pleurochrysis_carterae.AAC.1